MKQVSRFIHYFFPIWNNKISSNYCPADLPLFHKILRTGPSDMIVAPVGPRLFITVTKQLASRSTWPFLAHLVYQPKSLTQSRFVSGRWHWRWHCGLCTPPLATGLDIETSYLVYMCTCVPDTCAANILWFWLVIFKWQPFWILSLICCPAHSETSYHTYLCISSLLTYTKGIMPLYPFLWNLSSLSIDSVFL